MHSEKNCLIRFIYIATWGHRELGKAHCIIPPGCLVGVFFPHKKRGEHFQRDQNAKRKKKTYKNVHTDAMESFSLLSVFGLLFLKLDFFQKSLLQTS